ncbi:hypothetical protein [Sphaerochaeta halotolerans]|uniref:hypothetical protein n=1 Tax=Sphaerochaeta halotolerans TaxID=2293840 RepID=UPI001402DC11|nr:hypothetical protein [Sphaerochaeta halotolerans]
MRSCTRFDSHRSLKNRSDVVGDVSTTAWTVVGVFAAISTTWWRDPVSHLIAPSEQR